MAGNLTAMIAAAFSGGAAPPVTSDPYYEYTTLLLPGNGTNGAQNNTFLDGSTNNFTITRNGNTTQGTFSPFSQTGWGNYFDGTNAYLTTPANTAFAFGTGDFTVEMFVNTSNITNGGFVSHGPSATSGYWMFELSGGTFFWQASGVANIIVVSASSYLSNSVWTHLCVSRVSGTTRMFANGTQIASATDNTNYSGSSSGSLSIGRSYNGTYTTGYISNLRIVKGTGVTTVTVPTAPLTAISGTSILTCQSNRFIDNSTNNFTITRNGNASVVAFSPFNPSASWSAATYGGSGYFDGSGDYLTADNLNIGNFGTDDFTIECWFYANDLANYRSIAESRTSNGTTTGWALAYDANGTIYFYSNAFIVNSGTGAVILKQWNHVAVTRQSGTNRLFLNGALIQSSATSRNYTDNNFKIATRFDNGGEYFNGYISSFRVVKGTAVYTAAFTPPTAPVTAITNTSLLLNFTNAGIYDATSKNDLETVGNAQISNTTAKWGSTSIKFDGTGDYLTSNPATTDMYAFGSGDFTIEFWMYISVLGTNVPYDQRTTGGSGATSTLYITSSTLRYYVSGSDRITSSTLSTGQWYHVAVARSGTSTKMFINGTQAGSTYTDSTVYTNSSLRPFIGGDSNNPGTNGFNGYMQDLRITKGYARYTANFTAPTAAFPTL